MRLFTASFVLLFVACQSTRPALLPLAVDQPFAVAYHGEVAPIRLAEPDAAAHGEKQLSAFPELSTERDQKAQWETTPAATLVPNDAVSVRATILELDVEDARMLLENLEQDARGDFRSAAAPTFAPSQLPLAGLAGAHLRSGQMAALMAQLKGRANVVATPRVVTSMGNRAQVSISEQTAFVRSVELEPVAGRLRADPEVDVFEHGMRLAFLVSSGKASSSLEVVWQITEPVRPIPVARSRAASLQLPVVLEHRIVATTPIAAADAMILGSLPGANDERVLLLCVEVETGARIAAAR